MIYLQPFYMFVQFDSEYSCWYKTNNIHRKLLKGVHRVEIKKKKKIENAFFLLFVFLKSIKSFSKTEKRVSGNFLWKSKTYLNSFYMMSNSYFLKNI